MDALLRGNPAEPFLGLGSGLDGELCDSGVGVGKVVELEMKPRTLRPNPESSNRGLMPGVPLGSKAASEWILQSVPHTFSSTSVEGASATSSAVSLLTEARVVAMGPLFAFEVKCVAEMLGNCV